MPKFTKAGVSVETDIPTEIVQLQAQGFAEEAPSKAAAKPGDEDAAASKSQPNKPTK